MGYSKQIIKGFSWTFFLNGIAMTVSFGKIVILSHFIFGPTEFGVFGVGILVLGILELITETGINVFLVQENQPLTHYLDTAWAVSIMRGIVIGLAMALLAYPICVFFRITPYLNFILAFSIVPVLRGFINPAIANLQKKLRFKQDAFYRFAISFTQDIGILIFAIITHSIFSFIFGILIGVFIEVGITFVFIKERPKFSFNSIHFMKIINRGKWVTLAMIFDYLFEHTDDFVVGRVLNVASLGIYQNSYTLSILPQKAVAEQLGKVTFPVYVKFTEDSERIKKAFTRTFWATFAVILPFGIGIFLFSDQAVRIFLGPKWLDAIPVLRVLALFGVARAMTNLFYSVFLAFKKQRYITITTLVGWIMLAIFVLPLTQRFGITGASIAALLGSVAGFPVAIYFYKRIFD